MNDLKNTSAKSSPSAAAKKCRGCSNAIVNVNPVSCKLCAASYHPGCAKNTASLPSGGFQKCCGAKKALSLEDIRQMFRSENTTLRTELSQDYKEAIDPLQKDIAALKEDVAKYTAGFEEKIAVIEIEHERLNADLQSARTDINKNSEAIATIQSGAIENAILEEVEDRTTRSTNVIVFGCQESKDDKADIRQQFDLHQIGKLFGALDLDITPIDHHRLGKYSSALTLPRPLKIRFRHSHETDLVIQSLVEHKRKKSLPEDLAVIAISKDRTLRQRTAQKEAEAELRRRVAEGETGLKIVMKRGVPSIIKRRPHHRNATETNSQS